MMKKCLVLSLVFVFSVLVCSEVFAEGGHIHTGDFEVELENNELHLHPRVLGAELGGEGVPFATDHPGFDSEPGTFAITDRIGFNILSPLKLWNGSGYDVLDPLSQETMEVSYSPTLSAVTDTGFVAGFDLPVEDSGEEAGSWHEHFDFLLNGSGGNPGNGVYLLEMELYNTNSAISNSEPFWIVFDNGMGETVHEEAEEWVEVNLVPEPLTAMLLGGGMLFLRIRKKD